MESNSNDNYVLVLGDRTEVKNENDAGRRVNRKEKNKLFF